MQITADIERVGRSYLKLIMRTYDTYWTWQYNDDITRSAALRGIYNRASDESDAAAHALDQMLHHNPLISQRLFGQLMDELGYATLLHYQEQHVMEREHANHP